MQLNLASATKQLFILPLFIFGWHAMLFYFTCQIISKINPNMIIPWAWILLPLFLYCLAFHWIHRYAVIFYLTMFIMFASIALGNFLFLIISCYAGTTFLSFIICSSAAFIGYLFIFIHLQRKIDWSYIKKQTRLGHRELADGYFRLNQAIHNRYSVNHIYIQRTTPFKPWEKLIRRIFVDIIILTQPIAGFLGMLVNRYSPGYAAHIILAALTYFFSLFLISTTQRFYINAKIIYTAQKNLGRPVLISY